MKNDLLTEIIIRLLRNNDKNKNIIWVCEDYKAIRENISKIIELNIDYAVQRSDQIIRLNNGLVIRFIVKDHDVDKIRGLLIDEIIIDEIKR